MILLLYFLTFFLGFFFHFAILSTVCVLIFRDLCGYVVSYLISPPYPRAICNLHVCTYWDCWCFAVTVALFILLILISFSQEVHCYYT